MGREKPTAGENWYGKEVLEVRDLSLEEWIIFKIPGNKSEEDFIVKVTNPEHPQGIAVQHAHFAIDYYGKLKHDETDAKRVFEGLIEIWKGKEVESVLERIRQSLGHLPGYDPEYIFYTMDWILDQEDINYNQSDGRSEKKQRQLDTALENVGVEPADGREGSQLAIGLFCDITSEVHPVEALRRAGLRITRQH